MDSHSGRIEMLTYHKDSFRQSNGTHVVSHLGNHFCPNTTKISLQSKVFDPCTFYRRISTTFTKTKCVIDPNLGL